MQTTRPMLALLLLALTAGCGGGDVPDPASLPRDEAQARTVKCLGQKVTRQRLDQHIGNAQPHGFYGQVNCGLACKQNGNKITAILAAIMKRADKVKAILGRRGRIADHQIDPGMRRHQLVCVVFCLGEVADMAERLCNICTLRRRAFVSRHDQNMHRQTAACSYISLKHDVSPPHDVRAHRNAC